MNRISDIVMHSATKFIAGHSDLMAGVLAVKGERCVDEFHNFHLQGDILDLNISFSISFGIVGWLLLNSLTHLPHLMLSLAKELYFLQNAEGSGLAPFDCWLCLRGIKTMSLRVEKQQVLFIVSFPHFIQRKATVRCLHIDPFFVNLLSV